MEIMWFLIFEFRASCSFILTLLLLTLFVQSMSIKRSIYIVYMDKSLKPQVFSSHHSWYSSTLDSLKFANSASFDNLHKSSSPPSLLYTYETSIYGFSVTLSSVELQILEKSSGFIAAYSDDSIVLDTTYTPQFLNLREDKGLWPISNYGNDVIIGVVDSGIWPDSPSFRDNGIPRYKPKKWNGSCEEGQEFNSSLCNFKLIGAKYFNKGLLAKNESLTISMNSARDTIGHGTHVSSIAAGNYVDGVSYFGYAKGLSKGISPRARLAIYKFAWDEGSRTSDALAGIESAIADGVDVLCLAFGPVNNTYFDSPIARGTFSAMEKGIVVCCSAGNKGPDLGTIVNGYPWVITVTEGSISRWFSGSLSLGDGLTYTGWSTYPGNTTLLQNMSLIYKYPLTNCDSPELLSNADPHGIIVCDIGDIMKQISCITKSSVVGAILISNTRVERLTCPCVIINTKDGLSLIQHIKNTNSTTARATLTFHGTTIDSHRAPMTSRYASRGHSYGFAGAVKPDIMAPGSLILGAWNSNKSVRLIRSNVSLYSDYNIVSGTSAASAHVAGVTALLKGAHPDWSPAAIRSAIMTTANPFDNTFRQIVDDKTYRPANPLAMGSGLIDPNKALDPGLIYDATPQDYVNLLCSYFQQKLVLNFTGSDSYSCENRSRNLNYPSFLALYWSSKPLESHFQRTVTNVGVPSTTYTVRVKTSKSLRVVVSPEILVFRKKNEKLSFNVSLQYKGGQQKRIASGELVWVEDNKQHRVRSPIVVSPSTFY